MDNPEISVILCTYNRSHALSNVLEDFKKQSFPDGHFSWELVIVDNNSTDGTRELVQRFAAQGDLPIQYLFEARQGKSFAMNTGVKQSNGHLIAFTDDDVIVDSRWLASIYKAFRTYDYNCFGGKVLPVMEGTIPVWLAKHGSYVILGGPLTSHDRGDRIKEYDESMWVPMGCNMFVRKQVFKKHGFFNTNLGLMDKRVPIFTEDSEIMFRFKKNGESILYFPEAIIRHPVSASRMKKSYFRRYYWGTGRGKARWDNVPPGAIRYFNIPRYIIKNTFKELPRFLLGVCTSKQYKRFYHEVRMLNCLGTIYEFLIKSD